MKYLNGCTFAFMSRRGFTNRVDWRDSLSKMQQSTLCDTVVLAVAAMQDTEKSTEVQYHADDVMSTEDIVQVIREAKRTGLKVLLKAMVNCRNGLWRANIKFDCEAEWESWFASYGSFVCDLAKTAAEEHADMFCIGCEMIGTDCRETEWRKLISSVRSIYSGPVTYNCDKW